VCGDSCKLPPFSGTEVFMRISQYVKKKPKKRKKKDFWRNTNHNFFAKSEKEKNKYWAKTGLGGK